MASKYEPGKYKLKVKRGVDGLGLFSEEVIPKGACIIEYVGREISAREAYTSRSKYLFEVNKKITIDGQVRSNTARYINHSCRPNCEVEIYKGRIFVMARRVIKMGEELNYDYGEEYMKDYIAPKGCRCVKCKPGKGR